MGYIYNGSGSLRPVRSAARFIHPHPPYIRHFIPRVKENSNKKRKKKKIYTKSHFSSIDYTHPEGGKVKTRRAGAIRPESLIRFQVFKIYIAL